MVAFNRRLIFLDNIELLRKSFNIAKSYYNFEILAICIMQDHIHCILSFNNPDEMPQIIRTIKQNFTKLISDEYYLSDLPLSMKKRNEKGVWQRRYYDHIIRNENDLLKHIDYIHFNSMKHYNIIPKDWKYSSFCIFVKNNYYDENWCNFGDKNNISEMELE